MTTANMTAIEKMRLAAMQKFQQKTAATAEVSPEQRLKDAVKAKVAEVNVALAVTIVNDYISSVASDEANTVDVSLVDVQTTANEHVKAMKSALTATAKLLQDNVAKGEAVDLTVIENFDFYSVPVTLKTVELPPLYKGAILQADLESLTDDQRTKFASVGITEELTGGACMLIALSFDKSANNLFAKVCGLDPEAGSIRVAIRTVAIVPEYNTPETVESFEAKVAELSAQIRQQTAKFSAKNFEYIIDFMKKADINNPIFAFPEGITCSNSTHVASYLQFVLEGLKGEK